MEITDLLRGLKLAAGPDPLLDDAIRSHLTDKELGVITDWSLSRKKDVAPEFTASLELAYRLVQAIKPKNSGGCSWEPGLGSARVDEERFYQAATPELSLCIAALVLKYRTQ